MIITIALAIEIKNEALYDDGLILVNDHRLCILCTLSIRSGSILGPCQTGNNILIRREMPIRPPVIPRTTSGFIFIPFVSSSKNLNRPALDAGRGAFFFLLITNQGDNIRL
jgi:hypothetical protein